MSKKWPVIPLGQVVKYRKEFIHIDDLQIYKRCRVQLHAQGIVLRDTVYGSEIKTKKQQICHAGELLVAEIDAKVGGYGIVPEELDGAIVSSHYFLFQTDEIVLDKRFLNYFIQTPAFRNQVLAQGSTNYAAIRPNDVFGYKIPLPSISEQRRIVAQIDGLRVKTEEAQTLRRRAMEDAESICRAILSRDKKSKSTPMRELVRLRQPDVIVQSDETYRFAGVYSFGRGVFRAQTRLGAEFAYPRLTRLSIGNFVYPKLMAWEGAMGIVPPECDGCVVSTEFPVFEVLEEKVFSEVLDTYFRMPSVWPEISGASPGTNVRRRRLNPEDFLNYRIPLPTRETQEMLRNVRAKVNVLKGIQSEASSELDTLLPAVIDKAFNGEF